MFTFKSKNKSSAGKNTSKDVYRSGRFWILLGLAVLLSSELFVYRESLKIILSNILLQFGMAFIVMGVVSIIIQFDDIKEYFQSRLKEIVMQRSYIEGLNDSELNSLQIDTLKAIYKNTDIDKDGSFLQYFQTKIQDYIGRPYRENVSSSILIEENENDISSFVVYDTTIYTCRAVNGHIQEYVKWLYEDNEFESVDDVKLIFRCEESKNEQCADKCNNKNKCEDGVIIINKDKLNEDYFTGKPNGYIIKIEDIITANDKLQIELVTKYVIKKTNMFNWAMTNPSRSVTFTITYPDGYMLQEFVAGIEPREFTSNRNGNMYIFKHEGWFLPRTGISWIIFK